MNRVFPATILSLLFTLDIYGGVGGQKFLPPNTQLTPAEAGKGATLLGAQLRKFGVHSGNLVRTKFFNFGPLGGPDRVDPWPRLEWPSGTGREYLYEMGPLFAAKVKGYNPLTGDSVWIRIVDDPIQDGGDEDLEPLPGFVNPNQDTLAFNTNPNTWPIMWGDYYNQRKQLVSGLPSDIWPGQFNYYDENNNLHDIIVADQESYYTMTDSANIDFIPGNTYMNPWYDPGNGLRGLGIRIDVRGYQWAAQPVEDIIIWVYQVQNISQHDLDSMYIGYFTDVRIGGPGPDFNDDLYDFDTTWNLVRFYDEDGLGLYPSGETYEAGQLALVFLESPGNDAMQYDGLDNDGDWDATDEEAQADTMDLDGLSDDLGMDGLPGTGDYGEGDGMPTPGEPDFDFMDPDEKQQLGLTSVRYFAYGVTFASQDSSMYELLQPGIYEVPSGAGDYIIVFGSGPFSLPVGAIQRFSIALVMGQDSADLYANVKKAMEIYRRNYRFPSPPPPQVQAHAGDKYITIYWDDVAEVFPGFQGYAIYRSEDGGATWGDPVTDALGRTVYWVPIAQFDLADGITGLAPVGVNGAYFYLGDDTGLRHSFTDSSVINGKRYWYAVRAYDSGSIEDNMPPILSSIFPVDKSPAVVSVIPSAPPSGFTPPDIKVDSTLSNFAGTGESNISIALPSQVKSDTYRLTFSSTDAETTFTLWSKSGTSWHEIYTSPYIHGEDGAPIVDGIKITVFSDSTGIDTSYNIGRTNFIFPNTAIFGPGFIYADYEFEFVSPGEATCYYSGTGPPPATGIPDSLINFPINLRIWRIHGNIRIPQPFALRELGIADSLVYSTSNDQIYILFRDTTGLWRYQALFNFSFDTTLSDTPIPPDSGDIVYLKMYQPFWVYDTIVFYSKGRMFDPQLAKTQLRDVAVVPNPYVVAALWETKDPNIRFGRGPREIHFINLPPEAIIRIYTINGELVRKLKHLPGEFGYINESTHAWNLLNDDEQEVSYGLYLYHVEGLNNGKVFGETTGKFAIIK